MRIRASNPVIVGVGTSFTVPRRLVPFRLVMATCAYVTAAALGNRVIELIVADGGGNTIAIFPGALIGPSLNSFATFSPGDTQRGPVAGVEQVPIPDDLWIQPQWTLTFQISGAGAGDVMQSVSTVQEWFTREKVGDNITGPVAE